MGTSSATSSVADAAQVRAALDKILRSSAFVKSERLCHFLRFVVESQLAGESERLKETVVGVEVFDREPDYDPRAQPIVRTEARRLRSKLEQYYQTEGDHDALVIEVPKGGYIPVFHARATPLPLAPTTPAPAPPQPEPSSVPRWKWRGPVTFAVLLCAIGTASWVYFTSRAASQLIPPKITIVSGLPGYQIQPSLSADGKKLAFVWNGNADNYDIYVKDIGQETPRRLTTDKAEDLNPSWSPDGRFIAFLRATPSKKTILVVPADGGPEREIAEIRPVSVPWVEEASTMRRIPGPAWSPDGQWLAVTDRCGERGVSDCIYLLSLDGLQRKRITDGAAVGDYSPEFSPGGERIAFLRIVADMNLSEIYTKSLNGGPERRLTSDTAVIRSLAWSSDKRIVFVSNRNASNLLWSMPESGGEPHLVGLATQVHSVTAAARAPRIACALYYRNVNIWRANLPAAENSPTLLIGSSRVNHSAQYSPDGGKILFYSDRAGQSELWVARADGSDLRRLTFFSSPKRANRSIGSPNWSPDGAHIVYDSLQTKRSQIYVMNADGSGQRQFTTDPGEAMMPTWSRDGRSIYYVARRGGRNALWKRPFAGGNPICVTGDVATDALESPDGQHVFFSKVTPGIWEVAANGGDAKIVPELASVIPNRYCFVGAKGIYFLNHPKPPWEIHYFDLATRRISHVLDIPRTPEFFTRSLSVSPAGNWLLYAEVDQTGSEIVMLTKGQSSPGPHN